MSRAIQEAWELLGVPRGSDPESVARAYRRLARANHPDVSTEPDAAQHFARIVEAYHLVRDHAPLAPPAGSQRPSEPARPRRGPAPDPRWIVDDGWTLDGRRLWSSPSATAWYPGRPCIVAGPVTVRPASGTPTAGPGARGHA